MESQAVSTDPATLAKEDERPQAGLETTPSTQGSSPNDPHRYQRDQQFHLGLKQAASRRRQIAKNQEQNFVRHSQEAAIARALHAAATEYCLPNASEYDDSFFYAAIDLAMKGSKIPLNCSRGQGESSLNLSDDLSLPDMLDALVNRSTRTIIQQKQEIYCLRLVVRELMQELLSADGDGEVSKTVTSQVSSPSRFESPKKYDPAITPIEESTSLMTPTTASTTIATPESFTATPQTFQGFGSTYSSGASNRHLISPKYFSDNSLSVASAESPTASPVIAKLKDVQKSLDATMKETEQNREGFISTLDDCGTPVVFSQQARLPKSTSLSPGSENLGSTVAPYIAEAGDRPKTTMRSIDTAPLPLPDGMQPNGRIGGAMITIEQTQSGYVVESILDFIIEKSIEIVGKKASVESRLPPNPKQQSREVGTSGDVSCVQSGVEMSARNKTEIDSSDSAFGQDTVKFQAGGLGESTGSLPKVGDLHVDPPARLTRIESRNFGDEAALLSILGEPEAGSVLNLWPVNNSNESHTHKPHIFEDPEQDDDSENDPDDLNPGDRRMVVLISKAITDPMQAIHQEQSLAILHDHDIEVEFVDGADPTTEEIRECLFAVSGISQVYPQFFIVDDDGMTEFLGNFEEMKQLHDNGELRSAILGISTVSSARQGELASVGHQEEKKDEQASNVMTVDPTSTLSTRSWDQGTHINGGQNREETDYQSAPQASGVQSSTADENMENNDLPIFIRDEGFSWIDPSPLYTGNDPPLFGKLAVIKEDPTGVNESFLSAESTELNSSDEVFDEGSRTLRWV